MKEFYAPPLDQYREMCEQKVVEGVLPRMKRWRSLSKLPGGSARRLRLEEREKQRQAEGKWTHLLFDVDTSDGPAHLKPTDIQALKARTQAARERANSRRTESGSSGKLAAVERRASRSTTPKGPQEDALPQEYAGEQTPTPVHRPPAAAPCTSHALTPSPSHPSQRHSLLSAPLRSTKSRGSDMSEGFEADPADQTIVQMVFCEETNQSDEVNDDASHLHPHRFTPPFAPRFPPATFPLR